MKAVYVKAPGGPDQLVYGDWADPKPSADEVVIKVEAAAVNHADKWLRMGMLGALPMIPGIDAAGIVVETGANTANIPLDARVLLNPAVTCDVCEYCLSGNHGTCRERKAIGQYLNGSYAEYVKIPARNVHIIRDDLSFEEAAAIPSAFFTAWQLLTMRARIAPGETVLIMAAASGVGSAAVQIARFCGTRVIATASSEQKLTRLREWGVDEAVNYTRNDFPEHVLELTDGKGPHVVIDTVGASMWDAYLKCVRAGGRIVPFSGIAGAKGNVDIFSLIARQISFIGSGPQGSKSEIAKVVRLVNEGKFRGVIDRVLPLKDAALAHTAMEGRDIIGKIVLKP